MYMTGLSTSYATDIHVLLIKMVNPPGKNP